MKSRFLHTWVKGYCPLWRARGVLILSACVNNSWTLIFKIRIPPFWFFSHFPQINVGGDSHAFSFLKDAPLAFRPHSRCRVGCNSMLWNCDDFSVDTFSEMSVYSCCCCCCCCCCCWVLLSNKCDRLYVLVFSVIVYCL